MSEELDNRLFLEKYVPTTIDDMVLSDDIRSIMKVFIAKGAIPNLLLSGRPGIGKSTLAKVLGRELNADVLFIPASLRNTIDMVKNKIKEFTDAKALDSKIKIVILDESDGLSRDTGSSSAQDSLRCILDASQCDTRFILTCNYVNKMLPALRSRCTAIDIKFELKDVAVLVKRILDTEKIEYSRETFTSLFEVIKKRIFPDIRATIGYLEQCIVNNKLVVSTPSNTYTCSEVSNTIVRMMQECASLVSIRQYSINVAESFGDDWEALGGELFNIYANQEYSELSGKKLELIADFIMRMHTVEINKDIQFATLIHRLLKLK